ncbi:PREDICTED: rho-N domain-containing protein 1, chloroplastic isoform X3 [Camelina sativa]|uniref:Rho-N domain-containing protein 1, chloroplastic isoform X1 n=1 Tax=Camelina sativa TaxID=90675 RepID=A0ABM1RIL8_CAMSA|nr:PREDICTED: rho-N domain-containing protein 1, chloroplastic isoform X1 [Camelina sativa]XP_010485850.1 PREDICTED: rho-N domain-containing protein 1, chloroplastic isoform X2 [Camelina sativa]XP_019098856.1 PREDICTED: rho-N domain-containing protein 1, chloroplastic isoform X3 [Camelina sativa]
MAMSGTFHLNCDYVPGCTLSGSRCFSNSAVSRRTLAILPWSSCLDHKNGRLKSIPNTTSFVCRASSGGYRRNPDFSRLNKHGSRGGNRQNEGRDDFDIENSDMLSSRNGPLLSLSNSPKFQATSSPGPREKEIVELFRKVQAQLRARAAAKKEEKKIEESSKGQGKESETVDSLLKLLRKHSGEQSKKQVSKFSSQGDVHGDTVDKQDRNGNLANSENKDYNSSSFSRPTSSFRRKSPVPRSKSPPAYSSEATFDQESSYSVTWTQKKDTVETHDEPENEPVNEHEKEHEKEPEYEHEPENELEPEPVTTMLASESEQKPESSSFFQEEEEDDDDVTLEVLSDDEDVILDVLSDDEESLDDADEDSDEAEEEAEEEAVEDLSKLKLMELRGIAKSRGLKGVSKMKKADLVELLGSDSS